MQLLLFRQGFNTQPPEGGCFALDSVQIQVISFNTQPPEGGCNQRLQCRLDSFCFNTQPPEGGWPYISDKHRQDTFQHTAA